ncbi:Uncharacterised protein [Klebsiella pneumoniae]|nr:Uncharacterised protein [Klebsiella pneumoniae]
MHIKNTIPAEFVFNSALMKNIENTLIKQHRTVNNERMITEIQHRLQTESNEILSDSLSAGAGICCTANLIIK